VTTVERKRNFVLAALLGASGVISLLGFVGCFLALADLQSIPAMSQEALLFYGVCFGTSAVCVYGMLDWKRWGVYGLAAVTVVLSAANVFQGSATFQGAVVGLLLIVTFIASLRPAWRHFD